MKENLTGCFLDVLAAFMMPGAGQFLQKRFFVSAIVFLVVIFCVIFPHLLAIAVMFWILSIVDVVRHCTINKNNSKK